MHHCHQVPQDPKQEPGPGKGGGEEEELVAPLHVQKGRPEVTEVQRPPPAHMLNTHIASSIFGEDATPPSQGVGPSSSLSSCARTWTTSTGGPRGAQQGFGDVRLRLGVAYLLWGGAF